MKIDIKWLILAAGVVGAVWLVRVSEEWANPLTVGVAVGALLLALMGLGRIDGR
ncbi:hypothetical protein OHA72_18255 [Dactylosporangium sp. NBC_01737]|uniref:hypothetical protein n=1 Tax=Dactylosporangium sp. NBC_01737 TaxID=2975959 RepID=UPI002E15E658|nr:hypothetical protein OHA72_18255 [Dactylosporangium sp. NBC_01737]